MLRAAAGAVAVDVPMSSWFVLCITFGALFIVTGKRFAECTRVGRRRRSPAGHARGVQRGFLRFVLALACGGALVSYCMWAFERRDLVNADLPLLRASIVPVLTAFLRYAGARNRPRRGTRGGVRQRSCVADPGLLWVVVFGLAVYT